MVQEHSYAAIFMDIQMPNLDGLEATRQIRGMPGYSQTPIVAMTANVFVEDRADCVAAGMNDFLGKPFDPDTLFATLLRALSAANAGALVSEHRCRSRRMEWKRLCASIFEKWAQVHALHSKEDLINEVPIFHGVAGCPLRRRHDGSDCGRIQGAGGHELQRRTTPGSGRSAKESIRCWRPTARSPTSTWIPRWLPPEDRRGGRNAGGFYQTLQPDGVIAADDDAQAMFVVPFLKDKVKTPVMFNNDSAEKYGFPASNVSGILERAHVRESLAFAKQLIPAIRTACFLTNDVPAGRALRNQVEEEKETYPAKVSVFHQVKSTREMEALVKGGRSACDTILIDSLEGMVDYAARP